MIGKKQTSSNSNLLIYTLLILVLILGGYLRLVGLDWDEEQHLHPDERFLTMVESSLVPVASLGEYFDTAASTLNPANQGHSFYVYGTLPIFMVRYAGEWLGFTGYGSIYLVGRVLSAMVDLLTVALVFFIGARLYNRWVGLIGSAFSSLAVLQIQQSHFFTVDTFLTFFTLLTIYFAVEVATRKQGSVLVAPYIYFGIALGLAVASKITAAPVAVTLPLAGYIYWRRQRDEHKDDLIPRILVYLVIAALVSVVTFRIVQPYAFDGPGFFNFSLNQNWVSGLRALHAQTSGDVDFPPALQWARRPLWFSLKNMVVWGMGIPYAVLAWLGFGWIGWKMLSRREWNPTLVIWIWTGLYIVWQSLQWNSTMRYQMPIYPLMAVFAGYFLVDVWRDLQSESSSPVKKIISPRIARLVLILIGVVALIFTAGWAFAFSRIYTMPHPRVAATRWIFSNVPGPANLEYNGGDRSGQQLLTYPEDRVIDSNNIWLTNFEAKNNGELTAVSFPEMLNQSQYSNSLVLSITITNHDGEIIGTSAESFNFEKGKSSGKITFDSPVILQAGQVYQLKVAVENSEGAVTLKGTGIANESSWDDGLPLRMDGYDPFGGIYTSGLNFEMYWDDNQEKKERFISVLDQAEYLIISSSRQWATTTRVPERYPFTTEYYRQLVGCPVDSSVEDCYNRARPESYIGNLGFELIQTFQSNPTLGFLEINDQPAEEAFTVYDHPKVFIFKKKVDFDLQRAADILGVIDLSKVIHITPKQADDHPGNLMLPADRLVKQRAGGTWSELFNPDGLQNKNQVVAALFWYLAVFFLGIVVYPLMRYLFSGLRDYGYPLARTSGTLLLSYLVWLAGSSGIPFLRVTILGIFILLTAAGLAAGYHQKDDLLNDWRTNKKYLIIIEGLAISLFILGLLIRFGNPDLWHPWKGGEKPMDFSYFNAVLKSTSFPPYDPWFSGGYINYYYYGFVFVGVLVKLLGIMPSLAYNLILPTLFMFLGLGAFSLGWNLIKQEPESEKQVPGLPLIAGSAGVLGLIILGNLGILRMVFQGIQRLASAGVNVLDGSFFQRFVWTILGFIQLFRGRTLGYRLDEWYWNPSRAIGAEHGGPITEFPFFTFLYGDMHAHFIALPITLLVIAWAVSVVLSTRKSRSNHGLGSILIPLFGALAVGALRPTNTWDFYPYLALGACAIIYQGWWEIKSDGKSWIKNGLQLLIFLTFSFLLYKPYADWYGEGYTSIEPWFGTHTPLNDYFIHWGLFIFVIFSWMLMETIHWMATTPVSALNKLKKYRELIIAGVLILLVVLISFGVSLENQITFKGFTILGTGIHVIWLVLPMMVWAGILIFRPGIPLVKQIVLFLIGTALALTLMVEAVYVEGDIGRMNTVFKFYLQAWVLFAICSSAAFSWLVARIRFWRPAFQIIWQVVFYILLAWAASYPVLGGVAKIKDRMAGDAPPSLDGMAYMQYATYADLDTMLDLSQDYEGIRWMQENIQGSPIIVEANQVEYHWGTRYTVYTGLPGVIGWNWHQRQQRTITPHEWVYQRVEDVNEFYDTPDLGFARDFIKNYEVQYIVLGQLERAKYSPEGIAKFEAAEGVLWEVVYQHKETKIYQTLTTFQ